MKEQIARLGKSTLIYGVGGIVGRFINFLLLPLFTAYLSPKDFGISSILALLVFVVTSVLSLGLGAGIGPCYYEGNNQNQKGGTIWTSFLILCCSAIVIILISLAFSDEISNLIFQKQGYSYFVMISLWTAALSILYIPFVLRLQFEDRAFLFVILATVSALIALLLDILMVVILSRGVRGLLESGLISQAINLLLFFAFTVHDLKFKFGWSLTKDLLRISIPLMPSFVFLFVLQQSNKYFLQLYRGLDDAGIYSIGFNLGFVMSLVVSSLSTAWMPFFMPFRERQNEASELFGRIFTYYVIGFGFLNLMFYFWARPVIMIMTQPAFYEAYKIVGLSATAQFLGGIFSLLLPGIYFAKEVRYLTLIQSFVAVITVGLNMLLIPIWGPLGAIISLVLGYLSMAIIQYCWNLWRKYLTIKYDWKRISLFFLVYLAYIGVTYLETDLTLVNAIIFSLFLTLSVPLFAYMLLNRNERIEVFGFYKRFIKSSVLSR